MSTAGWYGKLPMLGDFAQRRLPAEVAARWDVWLSGGIAASRLALGEAWLETYLTAPVWCFACAPAVIDDAWWFGVMMPSVDAAGRYFPLLVMFDDDRAPADDAGWGQLARWYEQAAVIALGTLAAGDTVDAFEARLATLEAPRFADAEPIHWSADGAGEHAELPAGLAWPSHALAIGHAAWCRSLGGSSLWWPRVEPAERAPAAVAAGTRLVRQAGLPPSDRFGAMLDGRL